MEPGALRHEVHRIDRDRHAALLLSMHAQTILNLRLERGADLAEQRERLMHALVEQEEFQDRLRHQLQEHSSYDGQVDNAYLAFAYRWLRVCDLLSLAVLSTVMPEEGTIEDVPMAADRGLTSLNYRCRSEFVLELDQWPFSSPELLIPVAGRTIQQKQFANQDAYQAAFEAANWQQLTVTIRPFQ